MEPASTTEIWFGWHFPDGIAFEELISLTSGTEAECADFDIYSFLSQTGVGLDRENQSWDGYILYDPKNEHKILALGLLVFFGGCDEITPEPMRIPARIDGNAKWKALIEAYGEPRMLVQHF